MIYKYINLIHSCTKHVYTSKLKLNHYWCFILYELLRWFDSKWVIHCSHGYIITLIESQDIRCDSECKKKFISIIIINGSYFSYFVWQIKDYRFIYFNKVIKCMVLYRSDTVIVNSYIVKSQSVHSACSSRHLWCWYLLLRIALLYTKHIHQNLCATQRKIEKRSAILYVYVHCTYCTMLICGRV